MGGHGESGHQQTEGHRTADDECTLVDHFASGSEPYGGEQRADSTDAQHQPLSPGAYVQDVHREDRHEHDIGHAEEAVEEGHADEEREYRVALYEAETLQHVLGGVAP